MMKITLCIVLLRSFRASIRLLIKVVVHRILLAFHMYPIFPEELFDIRGQGIIIVFQVKFNIILSSVTSIAIALCPIITITLTRAIPTSSPCAYINFIPLLLNPFHITLLWNLQCPQHGPFVISLCQWTGLLYIYFWHRDSSLQRTFLFWRRRGVHYVILGAQLIHVFYINQWSVGVLRGGITRWFLLL